MKLYNSLYLLAGGLIFAAILGGCATPYLPAHYVVNPERPYSITTVHPFVVCPAFDRLEPGMRDRLDQSFNPSAYLTGVIEQELDASGVHHSRADFAYAPSFDGIQKALADGTLHAEGALVIASSINVFANDRVMSCDFKVYSANGRLLFEKRGLCINMTAVDGRMLDREKGMNFLNMTRSGPDAKTVDTNRLMAPRMVMQQLFADPDFQKVIQ